MTVFIIFDAKKPISCRTVCWQSSLITADFKQQASFKLPSS